MHAGDVAEHVRELVLDQLKPGQRAAELLASQRISECLKAATAWPRASQATVCRDLAST